jgi:hypothetical protein
LQPSQKIFGGRGGRRGLCGGSDGGHKVNLGLIRPQVRAQPLADTFISRRVEENGDVMVILDREVGIWARVGGLSTPKR